MTERQAEILGKIREHIDKHGYPPTLREIGRATGLRSLSVVDHHLNGLAKAGKIVRHREVSRGIELVDVLSVRIGEEIEATDLDGTPIGRVLFLAPVPKAA